MTLAAWLTTFAALTTATTLALSVALGWRVRLGRLDSETDDSTTGRKPA